MRDIVLPDRALAPFVRMLVIGRFDGGQVHLPATAEIQLLVYLSGGAAVCGNTGSWTGLPASFVVGPCLRPNLYAVQPGSAFLGILFRPGGFQACFGIPADQLTGRHLPLDLLLPRALVERLRELCLTARDRAGLVNAASWLLNTQFASRGRLLPALPLDMVLQTASSLSSRLGIGTRQLERRFLASHGMPLRDYRRLARFSHSLSRLMVPGSHGGRLADLALQSHYSDQAHFTREFQQFVGTSPKRFLADRQDALYRLWQFDRDELRAYADLD